MRPRGGKADAAVRQRFPVSWRRRRHRGQDVESVKRGLDKARKNSKDDALHSTKPQRPEGKSGAVENPRSTG